MTTGPPPIARRIPSILRPLYEFLFPPACVVCSRPLASAGESVCARCWGTVTHARRDDPIYRATLARLAEHGMIDDLLAGFYFARDGVLQELLHLLKYGGMTRIGETLGRCVGMQAGELPPGLRAAHLVPVPLHRSRLRERGYNQSEHVARGIAAMTGLEVRRDLLVRLRPTRSQTGLHVEERRRNMSGAFDIGRDAPGDLRGMSCILVDDVLTTGSTLESCARVLRSRGVTAVGAAVIAIAPLDAMARGMERQSSFC